MMTIFETNMRRILTVLASSRYLLVYALVALIFRPRVSILKVKVAQFQLLNILEKGTLFRI
jgi:hypothetical protein